jgi:hypothetical protein
MFCPDCGHELNTNLKFCPNCGKSLSQNTNIKDNVIQRSQVGSSSVGSINISPVIEIKTTPSTNSKNSIKLVLLLLVVCGLALLVFSTNEPDVPFTENKTETVNNISEKPATAYYNVNAEGNYSITDNTKLSSNQTQLNVSARGNGSFSGGGGVVFANT